MTVSTIPDDPVRVEALRIVDIFRSDHCPHHDMGRIDCLVVLQLDHRRRLLLRRRSHHALTSVSPSCSMTTTNHRPSSIIRPYSVRPSVSRSNLSSWSP